MNAETKSTLSTCLRGVVLLAIITATLAGGAVASAHFLKNRPRPERKAPPQMAPLVEVEEARKTNHQVILRANGTVIPAVEVTLQSQVGGRIVELHKHFLEGGMVRDGEVLARIEPRDYELAVVSQEAQLESSRYELKEELGQQDVAKREWELLDMQQETSELDAELALRKPQLRQKQAALRAAEAQLEQARIDLGRTVVRAPCNGIIRSADVRVGDLASSQTALATVTGTDTFWVRVSVPVDELKWVVLPGDPDDASSAVRVYAGTGGVREGRVLALQGDLESEARMARLLVEIADPLCLAGEDPRSPLLLGEYVRTQIAGRTIEDVFVMPRDALRDGEKIWIAAPDDTLAIVEPEIVWSDTERVVLRGLMDGDRVIVSDIATPVQEMAIRLNDEAPSPPGGVPELASAGAGEVAQ